MIYTNRGKFCNRAIFRETSSPEDRKNHSPIWTLKQFPYYDEEQGKELPSAYALYMSCTDEYEAALQIAGNMKNWDVLVACHWFREGTPAYGHQGLLSWREHMEARDASVAKKVLLANAKSGDTTAAKAILAETKKVKKTSVGRPKKKEPISKSQDNVIQAFKQSTIR